MMLKKGMHSIKAMTVVASTQPVVAQLLWSGPGIKQSLLGGGYVHSNAGKADKTQNDSVSAKATKDPATK